ELIDAAANAPPDQRCAAQKKCSDAILELWAHRAELPHGKRPFESLDPILRAIESLDPDNDTPRYFRTIMADIALEDEEPPTRSLLENVRNLDTTAKTLIGYAIADAAASAMDKSKQWITLADEAGADPGIHQIIVRFFSSKTELEKEPDP